MTDTLVLTDFFAGLAQVEVRAYLDSNTSTDEQGTGVANRASYGTRLWRGSCKIAPAKHADMSQITAKLHYLNEADVIFRVCPGWQVGHPVSAGTVTAIGQDRRDVTLSEVRPDGNLFSVSFDGKQSMHQVVRSAGLVHRVVPALPFGVSGGDAVQFGRPEIDAYLVGSNAPTYRAGLADGLTFEWAQTY